MTVRENSPVVAYQLALDQLAAVSHTDSSGRITHVNEAFERLTGYSAAELLGKPHSTLKSNHHDTTFYKEMWSVITSGSPWKGRICNRRKNGDLYWSELNIVRVQGKTGTDASYVSIRTELARDLDADQVHMSRLLSNDTILSHAPLILLGVSKTGSWLWGNAHFSRLIGWQPVQMERVFNSGILFATPENEAAFQKLWTTQYDFCVPISIQTHDGETLNCSWHSVRNVDGSCLIIGTDQTREVTQQKVINDQHVQLVSAAKLSTLGELAGGIAHEINNPVAIIPGKAGNIIRALSTEPAQIAKSTQLATDIIRAAERIVKIVKGLRVLARSSQNEEPMPERLQEIITEAVDMCNEKTRSQGIELTLPKIPDEVFVPVVAVQFGQVIVNLINNACDAIKNRTGDLWVRVEYRDLGTKIALDIVDCGEGIPEAIRVKLMTPFFTTKPKGQGTGLGLTISVKIIESFGGRIFIDEKCPNTKFVIEVPKASKSGSAQRSAA